MRTVSSCPCLENLPVGSGKAQGLERRLKFRGLDGVDEVMRRNFLLATVPKASQRSFLCSGVTAILPDEIRQPFLRPLLFLVIVDVRQGLERQMLCLVAKVEELASHS